MRNTSTLPCAAERRAVLRAASVPEHSPSTSAGCRHPHPKTSSENCPKTGKASKPSQPLCQLQSQARIASSSYPRPSFPPQKLPSIIPPGWADTGASAMLPAELAMQARPQDTEGLSGLGQGLSGVAGKPKVP